MNLSPHFTYSEMVRTTSGLPNNPTPEQVERLRHLCLFLLEPIRTIMGVPVDVSSGFRTPEVNAAVGGKVNSQHMCLGPWAAADIWVRGTTPRDLALFIVTNRMVVIEYDQVIIEPTWVHVSYSSVHNRMELLQRDTSSPTGYSVPSFGPVGTGRAEHHTP